MIKKNLSAIFIIIGIILIYLFSSNVSHLPEFTIKAYLFPGLCLIFGIGCILMGMLIQRKIKKKVVEKQLIDSLPD
jgi:hypothetical protein